MVSPTPHQYPAMWGDTARGGGGRGRAEETGPGSECWREEEPHGRSVWSGTGLSIRLSIPADVLDNP